MQVTYIDHMGTDLSVVNAARVSFNKKSEWEKKCISYQEWEKSSDTSWSEVEAFTDPYYGVELRRLRDSDAKLIQFLARGCTSGDWKRSLEAIFEKGVMSSYEDFAMHPVIQGEADENFKEMVELVEQLSSMPTHWTPFGHTAITLHIKAPIFVARQLGKHQVGFVWNEVSRRYVDDDPEFYTPSEFRKRSDDKKQGSSRETTNWGVGGLEASNKDSLQLYRDMIEMGIAPEQARMVLPQNTYTEWYWTGNLYSFASMVNTRTKPDTQLETQEIAKQCGHLIEPLFPVSWKALTSTTL